MMIREYLDTIAAEKRSVDEQPEVPATDDEILMMVRRAKEQFGVELPVAFVSFLSQMNGLSYNGLHLYGATQNSDETVFAFVTANLVDRQPSMQDYIFFGSNPPDVYVWNLRTGKYEVASRFADHIFESFDSCGELLEYALKKCTT